MRIIGKALEIHRRVVGFRGRLFCGTCPYIRDFAAIAESVCAIQYADDQLRI